jgi:replicative DNA helicase
MKTFRSEPCTLEVLLARERAVLGAAILDSSGGQADVLCGKLAEDDFTSALHRSVFRAIAALVRRNELPLEYVSVCAEMLQQGTFKSYENGYTLVSSLGEGVLLAKSMRQRLALLKAAATEYRARKAADGPA